MEKSKYFENIHYSDLFRINGRNWAILGFGKSQAGMHATDGDRSLDLCRDSLALKVENGELYGRFDPGMISANAEDSLHDFHKIDVIAYCLSENQTNSSFNEPPHSLMQCEPELIGVLNTAHHYPAWALPMHVSPQEMDRLNDPNRRCENFIELVEQDKNVICLLVPWLDSEENKGNLYQSYDGKPQINANDLLKSS